MEVGEIAIAAIDDGMSLLHNFDAPLTTAQTPYLLSRFSFEFNNSNSSDLVFIEYLLNIHNYISYILGIG